MSPQDMVRGIIVTHGRLGEELLKTAESILGPQTGIEVRSNRGQSHEVLMNEVGSLVDRLEGAGGRMVLFVDLSAGSCGQVCQALALRHPEVLLVCGINLPMLLEFLYQRGRVGSAELKQRILRKGREGVHCTGWDGES